jgi:hypothetical protein
MQQNSHLGASQGFRQRARSAMVETNYHFDAHVVFGDVARNVSNQPN